MPTEDDEPGDRELTWDQRILARIESGIDVTQIEEEMREQSRSDRTTSR